MELLEKRVKSRFSHRQIHLISAAAPLDHLSSYGDDEKSENAKSPAFSNFCHVCKHLLTITVDEIVSDQRHNPTASGRREIESAVKLWNQHVAELLSDEIVVDSLRQAWSVSVSLRRLVNLLVSSSEFLLRDLAKTIFRGHLWSVFNLP